MGRAPRRPRTVAQKARTRRNVGLNKVRKLLKILAKTTNEKQREIENFDTRRTKTKET